MEWLTDRCAVAGDFTALPWAAAMDAGLAALESHYAYTAHRQVNWQRLAAKYRPRVAAAEQLDQPELARQAYCAAWRDLAAELRDGHCEVSAQTPAMRRAEAALREAEVGGGYGVVFGRLSNGAVAVVHVLSAQSEAVLGDIVHLVNGTPVETALAEVALRWADPFPGTAANADAERIRWLSRGPVGSTMRLATACGAERRLVAAADEQLSLELQRLFYLPSRYCDQPSPVQYVTHRVVDSAVGVITLPHFESGAEELEARMAEAMDEFRLASVRGVVVDLRGNDGGDDDEPPRVLGFFTNERFLIEHVGIPRSTAELMRAAGLDQFVEVGQPQFVLWDTTGVSPAPQEQHPSFAEPSEHRWRWQGPTVVLINRRTLSNGDICAAGLRKCGAVVVGLEGSSGCVSLSDGSVAVPELLIEFTQGQSWDEHYQVQLEAGAVGRGGVVPDVLIPSTVETLNCVSRWRLRELTKGEQEPIAADLELEVAVEQIERLVGENDDEYWVAPSLPNLTCN